MKIKHLLMIILLMLIVMVSTASGSTGTPTNLTASTFYNFGADELLIGVTISVLNFNKVVSFDVGILTEMSSISYLMGIGLDLKELAKMFNWNWELSEKIKTGVYIARDFKLKAWRYGLYVGILLQI